MAKTAKPKTRRSKVTKAKASTGPRRWAKIEIEFLKEGFRPQNAAAVARTLNRSVPSVREKAAELEICHAKDWTDWELRYLLDHYHTMELADLAQRLCRRTDGVWGKAQKLKSQGQLEGERGPLPRWMPEEIAILKRNRRMALPKLAKKLSRTERAVREKLRLMGLYEPSRREWTGEEIAFLQDNHGRMTAQEIADRLGRPRSAVHSQVCRLGIQTPSGKPWPASEIAYLRRQLSDPDRRMAHRELAEHLGRTENSVRWQANRLGLTTPRQEKAWRPREIRYIKKHFKHKTYRDIGAHLGRSEAAVEKRLHLLGLRKRAGQTPVPWRPEEIRYLKKHYKQMTYHDIGAHLGRSEASVDARIRSLGLRKLAKQKQAPWRPEEIAYLKRHYRKQEAKDLARHLNRSLSSVKGKLQHLGLFKRFV